MTLKMGMFLVIAASLIFINTRTVLSQEAASPAQPVQNTQNAQEPQWVWGEVIKADPANKLISVKYLDYETDQEKEISIEASDQTTYENVKSIEEIALNDVVSVDYITTPDGKNIAKNISIEKPETTPAAPAPLPSAAPESPQQSAPAEQQ